MDRIGRYEILEELGRGAMGVVYRARDSEIGRVVALKVIVTASNSQQDALRYKQRFKREAQAAGRLSHPGIITVHDIAEDSTGQPYIVMEYVEGRPLNLLLGPTSRLPLEFLLDIGIQVAQALDFAHNHGVVHRDIKPPNILVTPDGHAKIADFGIARMEGAELTQEGTSLGTPSYMSPEQFRGCAIDGRSDIFSLGAVLYWMFTGQKPFPGDTVTITSFQIAFENPILPSAAKTDLPKDLDDILTRCLAKNPENRYATCADLAADLEAVRGGRALPVRSAARQEATEAFPLPARRFEPPPRDGTVEVPSLDPVAMARASMSPAQRQAAKRAAEQKLPSGRVNATWLLAGGAGIALVLVLAAIVWLRTRPPAVSAPVATAPPVAAPAEPAPPAQQPPGTTSATPTSPETPPSEVAEESKPEAEPAHRPAVPKKRAKATPPPATTAPPAESAASATAPPTAPASAAEKPAAAPAPAPPAAAPIVPSKLDVECKFPFKKGTLAITVDGKPFLQQKLEQKRNLLTAGITEKKGFEKKDLAISSGPHTFHVHIEGSGGKPVWDAEISGAVSSAASARLRIVAKEPSKDSSAKPELQVLLEPAK